MLLKEAVERKERKIKKTIHCRERAQHEGVITAGVTEECPSVPVTHRPKMTGGTPSGSSRYESEITTQS